MKMTFTAALPDQEGVFEKAAQVIAAAGGNITRASYNRAIDNHTLFIEIEGTEIQIEQAKNGLESLGYLGFQSPKGVALLEFKIKDEPGALLPILRQVRKFGFNISYVNFHGDGGEFQRFRMGVLVEDQEALSQFIRRVSAMCEVRAVEYDKSCKTLDNTVFYLSFASDIAEKYAFSDEQKKQLIINANLIMQVLEDKGVSPYRTFEHIGKFAELIAKGKEKFNPRITKRKSEGGADILLIEPPCGSNVCVIDKGQGLVAVDGGFHCYAEKIRDILREEYFGFDGMKKAVLLTHADTDHCGALDLFDEIYLNAKLYDSFKLETKGGFGFRERIPDQAPYVRISELLSGYSTPNIVKMRVLGGKVQKQTELLEFLGNHSIAGFTFEVYEGIGGHIDGETVFIERQEHLVFAGDIFLNPKGFTPAQAQFNRLAPMLLTSIDISPANAPRELEAVMKKLTPGKWLIFGGHGSPYEYMAR